MRVTVDENLCEANGFCESLAPDVFELGDEDVVQIADGPVPPRAGDRRARRGGPVPQGRAAAAGLTHIPSASMSSRDMAKYAAMRPYFEVVAEGLTGLVDGTDFFDMHAEDVVVEYVITVPDYPRRIVGREALAELYCRLRGFDRSERQQRRVPLLRPREVRGGSRVHHARHGGEHGCAVRQPIRLGDHDQGPQDRALARLPGSLGGVRRVRQRAGALLTSRRSVSDIAISS